MHELQTIFNGATDGLDFFSSLPSETDQDKKSLFNYINSPDGLEESIDKIIDVQDIIMQKVVLENEKTGEENQALRIILVTPKGEAYACVSSGVTQSVRMLFNIYGSPTWEKPIKLKAVKKNGKKGFKFTTLELV